MYCETGTHSRCTSVCVCVFKQCAGSQGIMWPQVISGAVGNVLNAIINYIFIIVFELGVA